MNEENPRPDVNDVERLKKGEPPLSVPITPTESRKGELQEVSKPFASETGREVGEKLVQPETSIQTPTKIAPTQDSQLVQPAPETKPKGFWQSPFKVIRNAVRYPTWEATMAQEIGFASTIPLYITTVMLGVPEVGFAALGGGLGFMGYEFVNFHTRERRVSNFFKLRKVMPNKEKLLKDETQVTLDDFVGELHISGMTRLWRLAFMKDKMKRALIVSEGILQGLVNIGEKVKKDDSWFRDFKAFKGTSRIVNTRIAERFGFEVGEPETGSFFSIFLRKVDNVFMFVPQIAPPGSTNTAWISKEKLLEVHNSGVIQEELAKIRRGLERREVNH